jgi:hypothetical protein
MMRMGLCGCICDKSEYVGGEYKCLFEAMVLE